ncbi:TraB/GumN family protein [Primorskyibacter sp. 2E107]|uniref:TraB/GumN family protein n=1 Tax=Primorskyibacter sp. 2E107 TaxID=3403458 RepID=UPI003AF9AA93
MLRLFPALIALALATPLHAACEGQDLRATMTAEQSDRLAARLDGRPYPVGNHWLAEKAGERLHLIGTVHINDPRLSGPVARLRPLVEEAALLLLELPERDRAKMQNLLVTEPGLMLLEGATLPELLPEDDWQRLAEATSARGIPGFMAAKFEPWYLSTILGLPPCLMVDIQEQNGLDYQLEDAAQAAGTPTAALEPFDSAIRIFADTPREEQLHWLLASINQPDQGEDMLETLLTAYAEEQHAASWLAPMVLMPPLDGMTQAAMDAEQADIEQSLLKNRNTAWIPVIEQALADTDGPVVAAFGAGHLSGEFGVLNLLAERGFTLTRQPF